MMRTTQLGGYELRRFRSPLQRVAILFLACVPLLYGALYLWSNWDPYGRLDEVPVAVVDLDEPVVVQGQTVDAGAQFTDQLREQRIFDWHFTDQADAKSGLADGRYYLTITVPEDFSANLASGNGPDPRRAVVLMHRDDVNGYVIGMLTASVQTKLENAIDQAAIGTYFQAVFANLDTIRDGMTSAVDGSAKLADGLAQAAPGAHRLVTGLADATSGSAKLVSGLSDAGDGAHTLADGLDSAATGSADLAGGLGQLTSGAADLASGAARVAAGDRTIADIVDPVIDRIVPAIPEIAAAGDDVTAGVQTLTGYVSTGADSLASRAAAVDDAYAALLAAHPELADDPTMTALGDGVSHVSSVTGRIAAATETVAGAAADLRSAAADLNAHSGQLADQLTGAKAKVDQLADGAAQVASGATTLHDKLNDAAAGSRALAAGIQDADGGARQLALGLDTLADGAGTLDTGLGALHSGAQDLDSGLARLDAGAGQLHDALADGVHRLPVLTPAQQSDAAQVLSSPADVRLTVDHPAEKYGRGLAPFFFAIAIWVFGISVFLVMKPISGRALAGRASAARLAVAGWIPVAGLATVGTLILLAVAWFALGLDPVHVTASVGVVTLAALCFSAIAHMLRTALGTVGSAVALVLLMVQLAACGGLYPVETLPAPLRVIHPLIPMSYLIDALRITFTGGPSGHLWRDIAVLGGFTVAALAAGVAVVARRRRFRMIDLYPALA